MLFRSTGRLEEGICQLSLHLVWWWQTKWCSWLAIGSWVNGSRFHRYREVQVVHWLFMAVWSPDSFFLPSFEGMQSHICNPLSCAFDYMMLCSCARSKKINDENIYYNTIFALAWPWSDLEISFGDLKWDPQIKKLALCQESTSHLFWKEFFYK
jgi:hypothetical protein